MYGTNAAITYQKQYLTTSDFKFHVLHLSYDLEINDM